MQVLHIDFETYSEANIRDVGAWAYSKHPSTEVLFFWWSLDEGAPQYWEPGMSYPNWVHDMNNRLKVPFFKTYKIVAYNDFFEACIMLNVLRWKIPEPKYWQDTAASVAALSLPRSLEESGTALGLDEEKLKDKEGKKLIQFFSRPYNHRSKGIIKRDPEEYADRWHNFKKYGRQDVVSEIEIGAKVGSLTSTERKIWELDRRMNLRGVTFDIKNIKHAQVIIQKQKESLVSEVAQMTEGGLKNILGRDQFLEYMAKRGDFLENAQKEYLATMADSSAVSDFGKKLIKLRLSISKTSLAKYEKIVAILDPDTNKAHGLLRYHGASTGRWSGNLFQPQNLPRPSFKDTDRCISLLKHEDPDTINMIYGDPMEALSSCIRGMLTASPGNRLIVSDFSQIESRVLAALVGDVEKMQAFRDKKDIYKFNAMSVYKGVPYEKITDEQRQVGKTVELACGYQGGKNAFLAMAKTLGVYVPEKEALKIVKTWRDNNQRVVKYWYSMQDLALEAIYDVGSTKKALGISFKVENNFLFCKLPSGRRLAYHRPHITEGKFGDQISFFGVDSFTKKYGKQDTYGGKLVENITQAVARDCMTEAMLRLEEKGYPLILTVHDEIIADVPEGFGSLEEFNAIMSETPTWLPKLPVDADGYESQRYRK